MKRLLFMIMLLLSSFSAFSQETESDEPKNSFYISYGGLGLVDLAFMVGSSMVVPFIAINDDVESISYSFSGNINAGYARRLNDWLWLGGELGFEHAGIKVTGKDAAVDKSGNELYAVMAAAKADWYRRDWGAFYSKLAAGVLLYDSDGFNVAPSVHLTLFGAEFGRKKVRGFAELGIGTQATASLGVRCRL